MAEAMLGHMVTRRLARAVLLTKAGRLELAGLSAVDWLLQKFKMAMSRGPSGQLPGMKRVGNLWNSRSVSRNTTGSWFASSWFRMKAGFIAISCHRYSFVPSSTLSSPATEGMLLGISMALQHTRLRSHESMRRFAFVR